MRVAFLTNIVSPYRRPVLERLAATNGWTLRVLVNSNSEFDRTWKVDTSKLDVVCSRSISIPRPVVSLRPKPFLQMITLHFPLGLWSDLRRFRPDAIISHELGPRSLVAALYARLHRIPLVIWAYQSRISATQGRCRALVRRLLLGRADRVVGMGTQAREVLEGWGVPSERIVDAHNTPDVEGIQAALISQGLEEHARRIRREVGRGRRLALVVGRLIPLKGIHEILESWSRLDESLRRQWCLVFAGSGPLASLVDSHAGADIARVGDVPVENMPAWYRAADLHVFPTRGDVWGLVVNEAMLCGVPTICSIHAGCHDNLVEDGVNGFTFDPAAGDTELRQALEHEDLASLGRRARHDAQRFNPETLAASFRTALELAGNAGLTGGTVSIQGEQP